MFGPQTGPCPRNQTITDLWDTDRPAVLNTTAGGSDVDVEEQVQNYGYEEERFFARALRILNEHDANVPLFLYYAFHIVHTDPDNKLLVPQSWLNRAPFVNITDSHLKQRYNAMVGFMDEVVGNITLVLRRKGMWNHTLVVCSSDNGGPLYDGPYPAPAVNGGGGNNFPLRGAKLSDWEGGIRVNAFVSGGLLPETVRGSRLEHFIHMADWWATFSALAGADLADPVASAAVPPLPPPDSKNAWPLLSGQSTEALHDTIMISSNTIIDAKQGYKLIVSGCEDDAKTHGVRMCDVTGYDMWTPPDYPNASQPNGGGADPGLVDAGNCTLGCLFNVVDDEREEHELSASRPSTKARLMAALRSAQATVIQTPEVPDNPACCVAAEKQHGGFLGPFLQ